MYCYCRKFSQVTKKIARHTFFDPAARLTAANVDNCAIFILVSPDFILFTIRLEAFFRFGLVFGGRGRKGLLLDISTPLSGRGALDKEGCLIRGARGGG